MYLNFPSCVFYYRRAASCAGVDADAHTKQLIRQYSVAAPQISPKRPFRLPRTSSFGLVSDENSSLIECEFVC